MNSNKNKFILIVISVLVVLSVLSYFGYKYVTKPKDLTKSSEIYTCPMHAQIIQDHFGSCPICGMDLVLKTAVDTMSQSDKQMKDYNINQVKFSPSQQVLANVQTEIVKTKVFSGEKSFNGIVKLNEQNFAHISARISGRIIKMFLSYEGQYVRKGQPVFELYSPELIATEKEFLLAIRNYDKVSKSGSEFATGQAKSLVDASRSRLHYFEMTESQINEIETSGEIKESTIIYSGYSGTVTKKYVNQGHWAMDGETIYDVADMSSVWVIANIYESEVKYIKTGQLAEIISNSYPGDVMVAKINFINPVFNSDSRTMEVRMNVSNPNYKLKPDMFVKVKINTFADMTLAVPKNSVIRTGEKDIVYIELENGVYIPKVINILYEQEGYYAVSGDIKEGDKVVSSGGFLIDSETQIQKGFNSGHEQNQNNSDNDIKINPNQNIMKDMENQNKNHKH
jgi:membrane fusion protein, copper/silver efflux system